MWSLTHGCFWLTADKTEIPSLIEQVESYLDWNGIWITKDRVLNAMNSIIRWIWWDLRGLPDSNNENFDWLLRWNLNWVKEMLQENA